jgi:ribosomal protein L11 methyltransferase
VWFQLQIEECAPDKVEQLCEALEETGALSITFTDKYDSPVLEPLPGTTPLWPDVVLNALYDDLEEAEKAHSHLAEAYPHLRFSITELADQVWERVWMDEFKPKCFGNRLWICPTWTPPPFPNAVNLILDPGLAFGTGKHETTSLCLHWLDKTELHDKTVIDYGCGSGILALAALKLGARHAHAVDIDGQALIATQSNAENNAIDAQQLAISYPAELKKPADILLANILLTPLLALQADFKQLLVEQGTLVISGLLKEQKQGLIDAYQEDFLLQESADLDDWSLLVFTRK